jgi:hypothetical protein
MRLDRCGTCKFWDTDYPGNEVPLEYGYCRRRPPTPSAEAVGREGVMWPSTRQDDWCGQWRVLLKLVGG